jgi:hypothetical protein
MTARALAACLLAVSASVAAAQSDIDPDHKFAWGENIGWTNWQHDRPNPGDGVVISATYLSGFVYGENIGWINLGDGDPGAAGGSETQYANINGTDFGVNRDASTDELFGYAWGENVGWLNFDGGALATPPNPARLDAASCRLRGFVWSENTGWVNLDDVTHFVGAVAAACCPEASGDANCDGVIDFFDIDPFLLALFNPGSYAGLFCGGSNCAVDVDCSGIVDFFDIDPFLTCVFSGCAACP